jgi:predicted dehydrogenase
MAQEENKNSTKQKTSVFSKLSRRDLLKGLASVPVLGIFVYDFYKKKTLALVKEKAIRNELGLSKKAPAVLPENTFKSQGDLIRVGIIGVGNRGTSLLRSAGFADVVWYKNQIKEMEKSGSNSTLDTFYNQTDLNIQITGICDVFDLHAERGLRIANEGFKTDGTQIQTKNAKRYKYYQDMLSSNDIDAVIIATPDFHHAHITIDAVNSGKHVYCEKTMTRTDEELYSVVAAVKKSGIVFQLGHQNSKNETFKRAKEIVEKNILGKITLVETTTNRNTSHGAWVRHLDANGNLKPGTPETLDWDQWLGSSPKIPFNIEHYYNWTKYFTYATGLAGQLLSHEVDAINQIIGLGIPHSVTSSGGIYFYKDGRDMADTLQSVLEFPDKDLTVLYSATLANGRSRGRVFMGHDASMTVGSKLSVIPDKDSSRFKKSIASGLIDPARELYKYPESAAGVDAVTSATEKYYAERGLINTTIAGKQVNITHLHLKEWFDVIRNGGTTACNIDKALEDTAAVLMAHKSYVEKRRVEWDPIQGRIV